VDGRRAVITLTAAERAWIRRQGLTARVLADEQRRTRERLSAGEDEVARTRERFRRDRLQRQRASVSGS